MACQVEVWRFAETGAVAGRQAADLVRDQIQRDNGERVGVQGDEHRQRQIDTENQRADRRAEHLERTGNQSAEHPRRHRAGRRMAVEVPQPRMQQRIAERPQPAVPVHRLVVGQVSFQVLAHGVASIIAGCA